MNKRPEAKVIAAATGASVISGLVLGILGVTVFGVPFDADHSDAAIKAVPGLPVAGHQRRHHVPAGLLRPAHARLRACAHQARGAAAGRRADRSTSRESSAGRRCAVEAARVRMSRPIRRVLSPHAVTPARVATIHLDVRCRTL